MPYLVTPLYIEAPLENPLLFLFTQKKGVVHISQTISQMARRRSNKLSKNFSCIIPSQIGYELLSGHVLHFFQLAFVSAQLNPKNSEKYKKQEINHSRQYHIISRKSFNLQENLYVLLIPNILVQLDHKLALLSLLYHNPLI